jgi:hypothetical protein
MVGDIDFIISKEEYSKAITVLVEFGYYRKAPSVPTKKHYSRLIKKGSISAVEIHKEIIDDNYMNEFNYSFIEKDVQFIKGVTVLSYANKLNLSIIANQINDDGFYYKTIALRNAYDVFLLSKKTNAKNAMNALNKLRNPLNCFLAACYEVFNTIDSLEYNNTKKVACYLRDFNSQFTNPTQTIKQSKFNKIYLFIKKKLNIILFAIIYKEYRVWLFNLLTDKDWYKRKLIQLGIKS